jgi:hypothetical protein
MKLNPIKAERSLAQEQQRYEPGAGSLEKPGILTEQHAVRVSLLILSNGPLFRLRPRSLRRSTGFP